jgi:hypothetical protein
MEKTNPSLILIDLQLGKGKLGGRKEEREKNKKEKCAGGDKSPVWTLCPDAGRPRKKSICKFKCSGGGGDWME